MKPYQETLVARDAPLAHVQWDEQNNNLLFQGKEFLWRWNLTSMKLQRLPLPRSEGNRYSAMIGHTLWLGQGLLLLEIDGLSMASKSYSMEKFGSIKGLDVIDEKLQIATEQKVLTLSPRSRQIKVLDSIQISSPAIFFAGQIWSFYNGLKRYDTEDGWLNVLPCPGNQQPPHISRDSLLTYCNDKVYRFDATGKLLQVLANRSPHLVHAWAANTRFHSYMFENGTLEVYDLQEKQQASYRLTTALDSLLVSPSVIVGITKNFPVVYPRKEASYRHQFH
ncbi:hypothetical protein [Pseudobacteriovorax antillogorgiicola]|nr:hypothetical protein [Pseudobacteriovorax antillogorgiicola]